ncbi:MAG: response regulator [Minisyncoccia bacterium]
MTHKSKNIKTVLVIEDERPLVQVITTKLLNAGFEVITARTVDQGLHYMEEVSSIDVVWLDHYLLGEKTGLDFVATLKSPESKWRSIPIFVVSNTASSDNLQSYVRLGVNRYSVKSDHRLDEITNDIKMFLEKPDEE